MWGWQRRDDRIGWIERCLVYYFSRFLTLSFLFLLLSSQPTVFSFLLACPVILHISPSLAFILLILFSVMNEETKEQENRQKEYEKDNDKLKKNMKKFWLKTREMITIGIVTNEKESLFQKKTLWISLHARKKHACDHMKLSLCMEKIQRIGCYTLLV